MGKGTYQGRSRHRRRRRRRSRQGGRFYYYYVSRRSYFSFSLLPNFRKFLFRRVNRVPTSFLRILSR